jgi:hypothetical protein
MGYPQRGMLSLVLAKAGWLFGVAALTGLQLGIPAVNGLRDGWALSTQGVDVLGQVSDMQITTRSCGKDNMDSCTDYDIAFDFPVAGVLTHGTAKVSEGNYRALTLKGPIKLRYLPYDPAVNEVAAEAGLIGSVALALIALAFLALGVWGLGARLRAARRMIWLREDGLVQRVRVGALVDAKTEINNVAMWRITWSDGAGLASRSRLYRQADLPPLGSEITIYADPAGKAPSVWEGDVGTR